MAASPHPDDSTVAGSVESTASTGERARTLREALPLLGATGVVALLLGALLGWLVFSPHHPGDDSPDAGFLRDMSEHHAQAVDMSFLMLPRAQDPTVATIARDIAGTQQAQIGQMGTWLSGWGLPAARGEEGRMAWMGHDMPTPQPGDPVMPGMASAAQMADLEQADGEPAEVIYLQLMINHHIGGVEMAQAAVDLAGDADVINLAQKMVENQQAEIDIMTRLLADRGAEPLPYEAMEHGDGTDHDGHQEGTGDSTEDVTESDTEPESDTEQPSQTETHSH